VDISVMTPEELQKVNEYSKEIAKILYADTDPETLDSLDAIERVVRQKMLEHVTPQVGIFLSKLAQTPSQGASED
jgi:hypothetical protein